jgi:hypothetical protein
VVARFGCPGWLVVQVSAWFPFGADDTNRKAQMRLWAALALARLHDPDAAAVLCLGRFADPVPACRVTALTCAARLAGDAHALQCRQACVDAIAAVLTPADAPRAVRERAAAALADVIVKWPVYAGDQVLIAWLGALPLRADRARAAAHTLLGRLLAERGAFFSARACAATARVIAKLCESADADDAAKASFAAWLRAVPAGAALAPKHESRIRRFLESW